MGENEGAKSCPKKLETGPVKDSPSLNWRRKGKGTAPKASGEVQGKRAVGRRGGKQHQKKLKKTRSPPKLYEGGRKAKRKRA